MGKWAIIDDKGKILTDFIYEDIQGWPFFSEGIKIVTTNGKKYAINCNGEKIFDCNNIEPAFYFSEGLISYSSNGMHGKNIMDKTGKTVYKSHYDEIKPFKNGVTLVKDNNGYGMIDKDFKVIVEPQYTELYIDEDVLVAKNKEGKWGYLDLYGKEIIPFNFESAYGFSNELANVKVNGKYGYIKKNGDFVIPPIYDDSTDFDENGYAVIKQGELFSIIDVEQNPLIPFKNTPSEVFSVRNELGKLNAKSDVDVNIPRTDIENRETIALIIANEKYSSVNVGNVQYAKNDGKAIKEYYEKTLGIPENNIMFCENATLSQMISALKWLDNKSQFKEITKAIVYYSGHGVPDYLTNKSYLLPSDGNSLDLNTAYSLENFYNILENLELNQCIMFIDACFAGFNRRGETMNEVRGISIKPTTITPQNNVIIFSASQGDEVAQTYPQKHHGMFTYYLLKFMQDNPKNLDVNKIAEYVEKNVKTTTLDLSGKLQTPTIMVSPNLQNSWQSLKLR